MNMINITTTKLGPHLMKSSGGRFWWKEELDPHLMLKWQRSLLKPLTHHHHCLHNTRQHQYYILLKERGWICNKHNWWHPPKFLNGFNCKSKGEDNERRRSWGALFSSQHFRGKGACWSSKMGLGWATSGSIIHTNLQKPNDKFISV